MVLFSSKSQLQHLQFPCSILWKIQNPTTCLFKGHLSLVKYLEKQEMGLNFASESVYTAALKILFNFWVVNIFTSLKCQTTETYAEKPLFFYLFTFNLPLSLYLKWISCRQHIVRSCFSIHSINLYILIGIFRSFTFNIIIDILWLKAAILYLFSVCFLHFSYVMVLWLFIHYLGFIWILPIAFYVIFLEDTLGITM